MDFKMNKLLKKMMVALLSLGLAQVVWADDTLDFKEALQIAEQGSAKAQNDLGVMYANGQGVRQDPVQAVQWFRKAAEQGKAEAQNNLGEMYYKGEGVRQDYKQAVQWFRNAAEQGVDEAQFYLGIMYYKGHGVRQDLALAQEWLGKACQNGYQKGCDNYRRLKLGY
jgi:identified by metaGeneAnnotator